MKLKDLLIKGLITAISIIIAALIFVLYSIIIGNDIDFSGIPYIVIISILNHFMQFYLFMILADGIVASLKDKWLFNRTIFQFFIWLSLMVLFVFVLVISKIYFGYGHQYSQRFSDNLVDFVFFYVFVPLAFIINYYFLPKSERKKENRQLHS